MSRELTRTSGGIMEALFGGKQSAPERRHYGELSAMAREQERAVEAVALVHEAAREDLRETVVTAMARNQAIAIDPDGVEVYYQKWQQTAWDTQAMVHQLARRLV